MHMFKHFASHDSKAGILSISACMLLALTGCQSHSGLQSDTPVQVFQPQLLNLDHSPSPSQQAKSRLVTALNHHLANEHMSIARAKYAVRPFVESDSLDADSQSLLQTVIQTYAYSTKMQEEEEEKYREYMIDDLIYEIEKEYEERIAEAKQENVKVDMMSDEEIYAEAERRYEDMYEDEETSSKISFSTYMQMKAEQAEGKEIPSSYSLNDIREIRKLPDLDNMREVDQLFEIMRLFYETPEQLKTMQLHYMQYFNYESLGHYQPQNKLYESVISYSFDSPTIQASAQLPVSINFEQAKATVDPSAALPLFAFIAPEKMILPSDLESHTISFNLPEELRETIASDVIFTSFVKAVQRAYAEMDSENFTLADTQDDAFARKVGASRAVKMHWGSKQTGAFLGKVIKSMTNSLTQHVEDHPTLYPEEETMTQMIKTWGLMSKDFQSKDVGGLLQLIEAVVPINFNKTTYYYLSRDNHLIASQAKSSLGSEFYGWTIDEVKQTRYDQKSVQASPLYALFDEDFGKNAPASIDGIKWFLGVDEEKNSQEQKWLDEASSVRYDYDYEDYDSDAELIIKEAATEVAWEGTNNTTIDTTDDSFAVATQANDELLAEIDILESDDYSKAKQAFRKFEKPNVEGITGDSETLDVMEDEMIDLEQQF